MCDKLVKNGVDTQQVRLFVSNQFPPGDCIPPAPASLTEIFEAITHHRLWDYFHYSPLVRIAEKFGAGDPEIEGWVQSYKKDLKAYKLITTVEDYIEADLDALPTKRAKYDLDTPLANCTKYDLRYNSPVEWKTKFIDHSLQYLTDVWELFSYHYLVPNRPPTALLDRVRRGCFTVTWLVPSHLISELVKRAKVDTDFFQQHRILKLTVGDECIYEEVAEEFAEESSLVRVCTVCSLDGFEVRVPCLILNTFSPPYLLHAILIPSLIPRPCAFVTCSTSA